VVTRPPDSNVYTTLSPNAYVLFELFKQFKNHFTKYETMFCPELTYERVAADAYALRMYEPSKKFQDAKVLPLVAYTRSPLQRFEGREIRFTNKTFLAGDDQHGHFNVDVRMATVQFDVPMRFYFEDPFQYENFESLYMTTKSINQIRTGKVKLPYIDNTATYTLIWGDLEDVEWQEKSKGQVSVGLNLQVLGPTFTYIGKRNWIERIIFEIRDYKSPDIVYSVQEFVLKPRPSLPKPPSEEDMKPGTYNMIIYRGDSYRWQFNLWADPAKTVPTDLNGVETKAEIRDKPGGAFVCPLTVDIEMPNTIHLSISAAASSTLPVTGVWDLQLTYPDGVVTTVLGGGVTVTPDVTGSNAGATSMATGAQNRSY